MTNSAINLYDSQRGAESVEMTLTEAMELAHRAIEQGEKTAIQQALDALEEARPDANRKHVQLHEAACLAKTAQDLDRAERLTIRSLLKFPKYGQSFTLLGDILSGKDRKEEAAMCYQFKIPETIEAQYFQEFPVEFIDSSTESDTTFKRIAYASERIKVEPPVKFHPTSLPELNHDELTAAEAYVAAIPDGKLWYDGGHEIAWDKQGRIVSDVSIGQPKLVQACVRDMEPTYLPGKVCLLGNRSSVNYYHWMYDALPRLAVLESAGIELDTIDHFVLMPLSCRFQTESLEQLGIGEDRLHTVDKSQYISADELYVPHFGSNSLGLAQARWNPEFLRRSFGPAVQPESSDRRLFISRGTTGKRGICNEPELMDALQPLGFELVLCENLSLTEQSQLFAEASVVVGPHGAGLTNIVYCQPGTVVLELFNAHMAPCFWTISELMKLRHAIYFCGHVDDKTGLAGSKSPRTSEARQIRGNAFEVDVADVVKSLAELGVT